MNFILLLLPQNILPPILNIFLFHRIDDKIHLRKNKQCIHSEVTLKTIK